MKERFLADAATGAFIVSPLFERFGVKHLFTLRYGGVSKGVYSSFNFAAGSGETPDDWANVVENHAIAAAFLGMTKEDICRSYQTHSDTVRIVGVEDRGVGLIKPPFKDGVDGLVTKDRGVLLSVRAADCVPILLYDTVNDICAAVHSGWRGTAAGIVVEAVRLMRSVGAATEGVIAAIGPSIGPCCYAVGDEVYRAFTARGAEFGECFTERGDKLFLDLRLANSIMLRGEGIDDGRISDCDECSACNTERYFSHRIMGVQRGTMAGFIALRERGSSRQEF